MRCLKFLAMLLLFGVGIGSLLANDEAGIEYLGHAGINVSDLDRSLHFYIDQLGLTEAFRLKLPHSGQLLVYLRVNDNNFVELFPGAARKAADPKRVTGIVHIGFFVKDLQATLQALKQRGYPLPDGAFKKAAQVEPDGTLLYFIQDPDGNNVELSQILPDSLQAKSRHHQ